MKGEEVEISGEVNIGPFSAKSPRFLLISPNKKRGDA
jgi:hypothetical protein